VCSGLMILHLSGRRLAGAPTRAERASVDGSESTPRQTEVVRTPRFDAEDAEFGHEDAEELSGARTTYPLERVWRSVGRDEPGPALGSPIGAVDWLG
jgi:hypothetical protein